MALAGTLEIQMFANVARIADDMAKAVGIVTAGTRKIETAAALASKALAAIGGGFTVVGIAAFIDSGIKAEAQLHRLALQTGITVETLSALRGIAKQSGSDLDTVAGAVNKLEKNMMIFAQSGVGKAAAAFAQLGYSQDEVKAGLKDIDAFLPEFAKRLLETGVGGEQAGLAMQLLARGGAAAIPFLKQLAENGRLVAKVTTEEADAAYDFEVNLAKLKASSSALSIALANILLPQLNATAKAMLEAKAAGEGLWGALSKGATVAFFGSDQNRNARELIELQEKEFELTNKISMLRARITDPSSQVEMMRNMRAYETELAAVNAQLKTVLAYRQTLAEMDAKPPAPAQKPLTDLPEDVESIRAALELQSVLLRINLDAIKDYYANAKTLAAAYHKARLLTDAEFYAGERAALDGLLKAELAALQKAQAAQVALRAKAATDAERIKINIKILESEAAMDKARADAAAKRIIIDLAEAEAMKAWGTAVALAYGNATDALDAYAQDRIDKERSMVEGIREANAQIAFETRLIGMTAAAIALENVERDRAIALRGVESQVAKDAINALFDERKALTAARTLKAYMQSMADDASNMWRRTGTDIAESLSKAFGVGGAAMGRMGNTFSAGIAKQIEMDKQYKEHRAIVGIDLVDLDKKYQADTLQNTLGMYGDMAGAAASYFDKQSDAYKVLHGIEQAMFAAKLAMQVLAIAGEFEKAIAATAAAEIEIAALMAVGEVEAAVGVAAQAQGDPYSAWIRMAAMAAAMAALGFVVAGLGGSSSGGQSAAELQKTQGTGTVLGDPNAKSESLLNALKAIEKMDSLGLIYTHDMLDALRNIQGSMAGLASAIYRNTGLTTGTETGAVTGSTPNTLPLLGGIIGSDFAAAMTRILEPFLGWLLGKTTVSITDAGLTVAGRIADLLKGIGIGSYANVHTDTGWLQSLFGNKGGDKTVPGEVDQQTRRQFALLFGGIIDSIEAAAKALDMWSPLFSQQLRNFVVDLGKISLDGLKGQELQDALNSVFSKFADQVSLAFFGTGEMQDLAKAGEGFYETLIRVATGNEFVKQTFAALGWAMPLVGMEAITARMHLIELAGGLENFGKLTQDYLSKYYSPAEQYTMTGTALGSEFGRLGVAMPTDPAGMRALIESIGTATPEARALTIALLKLAPTFYDFSTQVVGLDGKLHSTADVLAQHASLQQQYAVLMGTKTQEQVDYENALATAMDAANAALITDIHNQRVANDLAKTEAARKQAEWDLRKELFDLSHSEAEVLEQNRSLRMEELGLREKELGLLAGTLQAIQAQIDAQIDLNKERENLKKTADLEGRLDVLRGVYSQRELDRYREWLAADSTQKVLLQKIYAEEDRLEAASKHLAVMQRLDIAQGTVTTLQVSRYNELKATVTDADKATLLLIYHLEDIATAMQRAGVTATGISDLITKGLLHEISGADLGKQLGDMLVGGIAKALAQGVADKVTALIMDNLMTPIFDAIVSGAVSAATIHQIIEQADIDAMIARATAFVDALNLLFNDPAFKAAMDALRAAAAGFAGSGYGPSSASSGTGGAGVAETLSAAAQAQDSYLAALKKLTEETAKFVDDLAHLGESSYAASLRKINADAALKQAELDALEVPGARLAAAQAAEWKRFYAANRFPLTEEYLAELAKVNAMTVTATHEVEAWRLAQIALLDAQRAADIMAQRSTMEIELLRAKGLEAEALALERAQQLAGMDASLRGLQQQIWDALDAQKLKEATDAWKKTLEDWLRGSLLSSSLSPLTEQQKLLEAKRQYDADLLKARGGDSEARGRLLQEADALLAAEKAVYGFAGEYSAVFAQTRADIEALVTQTKYGDTRLIGPPKFGGPAQPLVDQTDVVNNVVQLRTEVQDMKVVVARLLERILEATNDQTTEVTDAVSSGAQQQAAATTNAVAIRARA